MKIQCELCDMSYNQPGAMKIHMIREHNQNYKCNICGMKFEKYFDFENHFEVVHEKKVFACEFCDFYHLSKDEIRLHKQTSCKVYTVAFLKK